ncbi:MAG: sulfatase-like hydrolase/transferase [Planctomycetes bacterium]|nr:sulfatase-like hydrolase/transferase [Planctomycetota bacterium]
MSDKPNILIIMTDEHHAGVMGCAGDDIVQTPNIDKLAARGCQFDNAYCPSPLCGPSRMSFMTGRYPWQNEIWGNEEQLNSDIPTFAHGLLQHGYDTVIDGRMHFVGHDQMHGFSQRILSDGQKSVHLSAGWDLHNVLGDLVDTPGMGMPGIQKSGPGETGYLAYDREVTKKAVEWLDDRQGNDDPFLLVAGYVAPHCPFICPPEDFAYYKDKISKDDLPEFQQDLHPALAEQRNGWLPEEPDKDAQWRCKVAYYGLCSFVDRNVGHMLTALEDNGFLDNTIVIYTSDHGEALGEHGHWWKQTFYEASVRIPMIVAAPDILPQGKRIQENVNLMDIGNTILDLSDAPALPNTAGRSLKKLMQEDAEWGNTEWDNTVFAEYCLPNHHEHDLIARGMIKSGDWKLNYYEGFKPALYNLADDPSEMNDLADDADSQEKYQELLKRLLAEWDLDLVKTKLIGKREELNLIGNWVNKTQPEEPFPFWLTGEAQNTWQEPLADES